ncbi:MAG TPA: type I restriction-modification system subunit M N-terminal domain-containing protein [Chitinophagales bacterium]|nr:type I restriction-modification system subunit M N-terminal domain-containing protein [Chitinophagales bacterium]
MLNSPQLRSQVDALWDKFWSGGISNPLTAIDQMSYLVFLKRLEDMDYERAATAKSRSTTFKSVFDGKMDSAGKKIDKVKCR